MKPILGIFLGEAAGIGPEVIARLVANGTVQKYCRPLLIGDSRVLKLGQRIAGVDFPVSIISDAAAANWDGPVPFLDLKNFDPDGLVMGQVENAVELVAVVSVVVHHVREVDARRRETTLHAYEESVDKHLVTQSACHLYQSHGVNLNRE